MQYQAERRVDQNPVTKLLAKNVEKCKWNHNGNLLINAIKVHSHGVNGMECLVIIHCIVLEKWASI